MRALFVLIGLGMMCLAPDAVAGAAPARPVVPVEFRGAWCTKPAQFRDGLDDTRLAIGRRDISFYESGGEITDVRRTAGGDLRVRVRLTGEGEGPWTQVFLFRLSPDRRRLLDVTRGKPFVRVRCGAAAHASR